MTVSRSNISKLQIFVKNRFHSNWGSYLIRTSGQKPKKSLEMFLRKYQSVWFWANLETFSRISPNCVTNQPSNYYQQHRFCRTWLTPVQKMIRNKPWIIKSRGFKIKNKILPYDLVIFQTSWCCYLEIF